VAIIKAYINIIMFVLTRCVDIIDCGRLLMLCSVFDTVVLS